MRKQKTREEKVATTIAETVNDVTLDLDQVGIYIARDSPTISLNRLLIVTDSAQQEKEKDIVRQQDYI